MHTPFNRAVLTGGTCLPDSKAATDAAATPLFSAAERLGEGLALGEPITPSKLRSIRRSLVMGVSRIELMGCSDGPVAGLKALGLFSAIIAWTLLLFVPADLDRGPEILAALLARHPLVRVGAIGSGRTAA